MRMMTPGKAPHSSTPPYTIGVPIILGQCPSLSEHESESMLRNREKQERERESQANGTWEKHTAY
jgi:hypothetical protein